MKKALAVFCALVFTLYMAAACAEGSLADAAADLKNAKTTDELLAMHEAIARDYAPELESGGWDVRLQSVLPEELPAGIWPADTESAVSEDLPQEMKGLKYIVLYQYEDQSPKILGDFLDRLPVENRAGSLAEVQAVLLLKESFAYNSGYIGSAYNRHYNMYIWAAGGEKAWNIYKRYTTPPAAGQGTLYGEMIPMQNLWQAVREVFYGRTFEITDESGNVLTYEVIGENSCCLRSAAMAEGVTVLNIPSPVNGLTVTEIGENCMRGNKVIEEVVIPRGVTRISTSAFLGCSGLQRAVLPDTLEILGENSFCDCGKLRDINLPDSLRKIENAALRSCNSLEYLCLPGSLEGGDEGAFTGDDKVAYVVFNEGITQSKFWPNLDRVLCCYLPSTLGNIEYCKREGVVYYAPAESYAMHALTAEGYVCIACERPEDMPKPVYLTEGDYEFLVYNGEASLSACLGTAKDIAIPDTAAGCPVTRLLPRALMRFADGLTAFDSVIVPETVKRIDGGAYAYFSSVTPFLRDLYVENPRTEIEDNGYSRCNKIKLHAPEGSLVQQFAEKYDIPFEAWDGQQ